MSVHVTTPTASRVLTIAREAERHEGMAPPGDIVTSVMGAWRTSWLVWRDDKPVVAVGAIDAGNGVWRMYCFGDIAKVILPLTKWVKNHVVPRLVGHGATRIEGYTHHRNAGIQRWMGMCGGKRDGTVGGHVRYAIVLDATRGTG